MKNIDGNYILIIIGFLAILVELILGVVTGFDLLLLGIAFIIGGLVGMGTDSFNIGLTVVFILSILYFLIGRKIIKKELALKTTKTSVDNLLLKQGIVVKKITPDKPGQIKVEGEIWRAESPNVISEGASVIIQSVNGVTLLVSPKK
ncbi:MAG TPA: NfeD family protein [Candidatus Nitrosocosmicus sp.]|nr:NfeD family protein [Candidatus Nitrosocosmicus sp.]